MASVPVPCTTCNLGSVFYMTGRGLLFTTDLVIVLESFLSSSVDRVIAGAVKDLANLFEHPAFGFGEEEVDCGVRRG